MAMHDQLPKFIPPVGLAICELANFDMTSDGSLELVLNLTQQTLFYKSQLYNGFLKERWLKRFHLVRGKADMSEPLRLNEVKSLLKDENMCQGFKVELEVICALLGAASIGTKLQYVLEDPSRFQILEAWNANHKILEFKAFAEKTYTWKDHPADKFLTCAFELSQSKSLANLSANPVVKQILGIMCKGMSLRQDPPDESDSALMKLLSMAVTELAVLKLEIEQQKTTEA